MPAQHYPRHGGLKKRSPRRPGVPLPGVGGYDYPRGPYGATGFPGSTPAAPPVHPQDPEGQRGARQTGGEQISHGVPQWTKSQAEQDWARFIGPDGQQYAPPARGRRVRGSPQRDAEPGNWDAEVRSSPDINHIPPGNEKQRNTVYYGGRQAAPWKVREYLSSPNPGKNGGQPARDMSAGYDNDAGAVVGGQPTPVTVMSRLVLAPDTDGYAVQAPKPLKVHAMPDWYRGDRHLRGAILDGTRYTGDVRDQQMRHREGQGSYGIARRRGPNHRPVRFERPGPWTANYYDSAPDQGTQAPDMIHRSPGPARRSPGRGKRH